MDTFVGQALHHLVKSDENIEFVRELLDKGLDPNFENSKNDTLLHAAASSTKISIGIIRELLNAGADTDRSNCFLFRPLHLAVMYQKRKVIKVLLQSRIHINSEDSFGRSALHYAVDNDYIHNVHFRDIPRNARVPDLWIVRKLLGHKYIDVNKKDRSGRTPLILAIKHKHSEIVKLLLNKDARLDISNEFEQTPLHIALNEEDPCPYIVVLLLLKRHTLLKMNFRDKTPLNILISSKSSRFARICLKVIAFTYPIRGLLTNKLLKIPELLQFVDRCYDDIKRMERDIIFKELTVFNFFGKCDPLGSWEVRYRDPILQIYKPVVERIVTGLYPEYFCYILHRISKSNLSAVLAVTFVEKYCKKKFNAKDCKKCPTAFSEVLRMSLLSDYLSSLDIFLLIAVLSSVKINESILHVREHECYLTDSWEEYPDDHFY